MKMIRTLGLAAVAALSLGAGAAMAQEGANDTVAGSAYLPGQMQTAPATRTMTVQSGSSDVEMRPASAIPAWQQGNPYGILAGGG